LRILDLGSRTPVFPSGDSTFQFTVGLRIARTEFLISKFHKQKVLNSNLPYLGRHVHTNFSSDRVMVFRWCFFQGAFHLLPVTTSGIDLT